MKFRLSLVAVFVLVSGSVSFVAAQSTSDRDFRRQVRTATERGRAYLLGSLSRKRRRSQDQFENAYPMGFRALVAYALLEAGVAPDGPEKCSGLPVARYDAAGIHAVFGELFDKIGEASEMHRTPWGGAQSFVYCFCRRTD